MWCSDFFYAMVIWTFKASLFEFSGGLRVYVILEVELKILHLEKSYRLITLPGTFIKGKLPEVIPENWSG